jgi:hypothetical protein
MYKSILDCGCLVGWKRHTWPAHLHEFRCVAIAAVRAWPCVGWHARAGCEWLGAPQLSRRHGSGSRTNPRNTRHPLMAPNSFELASCSTCAPFFLTACAGKLVAPERIDQFNWLGALFHC